MGGFIAKQPNGKYCRFSSVVDCPTHINMTFDDYVEVIMERGYQRWRAEKEAKEIFGSDLQPFQEVIDHFIPNNMTQEEFNGYLEKMNDKNAKYEKT